MIQKYLNRTVPLTSSMFSFHKRNPAVLRCEPTASMLTLTEHITSRFVPYPVVELPLDVETLQGLQILLKDGNVGLHEGLTKRLKHSHTDYLLTLVHNLASINQSINHGREFFCLGLWTTWPIIVSLAAHGILVLHYMLTDQKIRLDSVYHVSTQAYIAYVLGVISFIQRSYNNAHIYMTFFFHISYCMEWGVITLKHV